ncbi:juvenile hormone acid O-methyltransferase [Rhipicephalus sanguineus]|uniref:juvenile hormone acid O-methyltransferase n=1 Tax=Rhipicephalus sanguineus TaxID=34632 RepID=UPI001892D79D|nr:juvenile hormone acid O-methyltransferase [Rhipicephalus sanguineus]
MTRSDLSKDSSEDTNDPGFYARNNGDQRLLNLKALDMVEKDLDHMYDRNLQFLDLGCGTGDFTRRCLLPRCPPSARIVAVDSSEEMLTYARQMFAHPRIEYDRLDISGDVADFVAKYSTFNRIYSFFCLNWVRNQEEAMKNVSSLLSSGGECVLVFPAWSRSRMPWMKLARLDRWRKYKELFESFVPKSQDIEDDSTRLSYLREMITSSHMELRKCEILLYKPLVWDATAAIVHAHSNLHGANNSALALKPEQLWSISPLRRSNLQSIVGRL